MELRRRARFSLLGLKSNRGPPGRAPATCFWAEMSEEDRRERLGCWNGETYPEHSPSILSDAWLSVQGARRLDLGSTWDWKSRNYSREVAMGEASEAMKVLLPKASAVYPAVKYWTVTGAVAGLRAMPPLTAEGSLPLLGCVDEFVNGTHACKYWLFTGLDARGFFRTVKMA